MPTINQLVRKGRKKNVAKSKSPAMLVSYNSLRLKQFPIPGAPQKRGGLHPGSHHHAKEAELRLA